MVEYKIKIFNEKKINGNTSPHFLGIDIGGTNTNIGISNIKDKKMKLIFSLNFETKKIKSIIPAISKAIAYAKDNYGIISDSVCIAAAGVISNDNNYVKLTNSPLEINANEIKNNTSLKNVYLINDFQAIGYGINFLDHKNKNDIYIIREKNTENIKRYSTKTIIGAGTGLGKSILVYNHKLNSYIPIPSEGGHTDFPYQNDFEKKLIDYIKKKRNILQYLTYEEILSGRGMEDIYNFLKETKEYTPTKYSKEIELSDNIAPLISRYRTEDGLCKETLKFFARFYARCAKNFVLDTLSVGGIYIAGGIASKNIDIFTKNDFIDEFENVYRRADIIRNIPIYVIMNYDVSLYGACFAASYKNYIGEIL